MTCVYENLIGRTLNREQESTELELQRMYHGKRTKPVACEPQGSPDLGRRIHPEHLAHCLPNKAYVINWRDPDAPQVLDITRSNGGIGNPRVMDAVVGTLNEYDRPATRHAQRFKGAVWFYSTPLPPPCACGCEPEVPDVSR